MTRPGVTKLLVKGSEVDGHWVDTLVQFLSVPVASKITMLQIKQSVTTSAITTTTTTSSNSTSNTTRQAQDNPVAMPAVRSLLSRMRRNHQPTPVERALVNRQWLQLTTAMSNLQELDLSLIKVSTIEWLPKLRRLKRLSLDAAELSNQWSLLTPLGELSNMESLYVQNYMVPHAQEIAKLQQLKSLWINECAVLTDLSALGQLKHLQELTLTYMSAVKDLSFIQKLSALRKLKVSFVGQESQWLQLPKLWSSSANEASDDHESTMSVLSLPRLESVTFQRLRLRNLNFLALCPNLRSLAINAHEVTSVKMLAAVPELRELKLSIDTVHGGKLSLSPLQSLTKLICLELVTLRGRLQSDSLPTIPSLKTLVVPAMDDFEPLCHHLSSLSSLTVRDCSQVDVDYAPVLMDLPFLTKLTLTFPIATGRSESTSSSGRPLELSPLQSMTQLRSLSLIHVNTEDLNPLSELTNLEALDLSAFYSTHLLSPSIADFSPLTRLENLRSLSVAGRSDFDESDLEMLRNFGRSLKKLRRINTTELVIPTLNSVIW